MKAGRSGGEGRAARAEKPEEGEDNALVELEEQEAEREKAALYFCRKKRQEDFSFLATLQQERLQSHLKLN